MIRSMTGYGKVQQQHGQMKIIAEIKSLNSKQLDLVLRLPADFKMIEFELRNLIAESVKRGKVDFVVSVEGNGLLKSGRIDQQAATLAFQQIKETADSLSLPLPEDVFSILIKYPGVIANGETDIPVPEELAEATIEACRQALASFDTFRAQEGAVLKSDIENRIYLILQLLDKVEPFENQRTEQLKQRLGKNIAEVSENLKFDPNRFEQELIYYLEKLDISEEKVRLRQHCRYFLEAVNEDFAGKKLGFIAQEIGREINTLGSKANDANIQRLVVQMKDELEKIKEQLFNIL